MSNEDRVGDYEPKHLPQAEDAKTVLFGVVPKIVDSILLDRDEFTATFPFIIPAPDEGFDPVEAELTVTSREFDESGDEITWEGSMITLSFVEDGDDRSVSIRTDKDGCRITSNLPALNSTIPPLNATFQAKPTADSIVFTMTEDDAAISLTSTYPKTRSEVIRRLTAPLHGADLSKMSTPFLHDSVAFWASSTATTALMFLQLARSMGDPRR